jgi:sugar phosphate isomerase/epimerase
MKKKIKKLNNILSRRQIIRGMGIYSIVTAAGLTEMGYSNSLKSLVNSSVPQLRGNINHSLVNWPYQTFGEKWDIDTLCSVARDLGCKSVELIDPAGWSTLAKYGLDCAIAPNGMPGEPYVKGLNNLDFHNEIIGSTKKVIEAASYAPIKVSSVIAFTGFKYRNPEDANSGIIPNEEGAENTVKGLKKLALLAERYSVDIYMEHLNSRIANDTNRGHPGYQGDDIDYCAEIIRNVGSPRVKLLFDIYHVQIMNGDIINRIREYGTDLIGHVHTAGVPGRAELGSGQELQYAPIMQALLDIGYKGFVGHEFIPTRDPRTSIIEAISICDV